MDLAIPLGRNISSSADNKLYSLLLIKVAFLFDPNMILARSDKLI